jgi:hypothetical protein
MNPHSDCTPTKKQTKALHQAQRRANPVKRRLEQYPTLCEDAVHAQTKLCKNMSQNNEQQQERCQACKNKSNQPTP